MADKKEMTMREFFSAVLALENLPENIRAKSEAELAKLNDRNAKRSNAPTKASIKNAPIKAEILKVLENATAPMTAEAIANAIEMEEATKGVVSYLCSIDLVKAGKIEAVKVKSNAKSSGKINAYQIVKGE